MNEAEFLIFNNRADDIRRSREDTAQNNVIIFLEYIAQNPELTAIYTTLVRDSLPDFSQWRVKSLDSRKLHFPEQYIEKVRVCLAFLEAIKKGALEPTIYALDFSSTHSLDALTREFFGWYFEPVFTYFVERLATLDNFLHTLVRFKIFTEWFHQKEYYEEYKEDTRHGESILDKKLREYLFLSGIDYPFSTPSSPDGRADVLPVIDEKPIPIEAKVYNGDMNHLRQGFRQVIIYAKNYNYPNGYLVIFNTTESEISFPNTVYESINHGGKTIFVIIINIYHHTTTASKRSMKTIDLTIDYLKS